MKKMANKKFDLGILAIVLVFGVLVIGCDDGSTNGSGGNSSTNGNNGNGGGDNNNTIKGTFSIEKEGNNTLIITTSHGTFASNSFLGVSSHMGILNISGNYVLASGFTSSNIGYLDDYLNTTQQVQNGGKTLKITFLTLKEGIASVTFTVALKDYGYYGSLSFQESGLQILDGTWTAMENKKGPFTFTFSK